MDLLRGRALNDHERRVAEFMRQAQAEDSARHEAVTAKYAVLTDGELRYRRSLEVPLAEESPDDDE